MTDPQVVFFDAVPEIGNALRQYWTQKEARLERLLRFIPAYQRHIRVSSRPEGSDREVRIMLTMPTSTLVGTGKAADWKAALDLALDHLIDEIRMHKGLLRRERLQWRKRRSDGDMEAIGPELEAHARRSDKAAFMEQIKPMLRSVRDHAQRELVIAQLEGHIPPGDLTVSDLLDEVIVRSWKRFKKDPAGQTLDRMLMSLLHEILDEYGSTRVASESLYQEIPRTDPRYRARIGWADQEEELWGSPDPLTLEELLPSDEKSEGSDKIREEEQRRWILAQLGTFPRRQRRAFTLHILEGWDEEAIGALQGRPAAEVREDIKRIQRTLRQRAGAFRETGGASGISGLASPPER
jgi:RNA polymerase sigma factor (sigma-70 family)